jgi:solute carrier family 8 (sodium/calcium exchanger)
MSLNESFSDSMWYFTTFHQNCSLKNLITPSISQIFAIPTIQAIGYFCILIYLFLGIAIVSDVFMCSIETITSQTRKVKVCSSLGFETEVREEKIWNDAVANLTLMALGSSAPEILLSIIEIVGSGFRSGELGPGTIVGSAAFNLMCITAVCVTGLKDGESKRIRDIQVFAVTSFFCIWAYIWLFLILVVISPDVVELWEAVVTFAFFPLLAFIAYCADKKKILFFLKREGNMHEISSGGDSLPGFACNQAPSPPVLQSISASACAKSKGTTVVPVGFNFFPKGVITKKSLVKFIAEVRRIDASITDEDAACLAANNLFEYQRRSQMFYRVSACRELTGARTPVPRLTDNLQRVYDLLRKRCHDPNAARNSFSQLNGHINRGFNGQRAPATVQAELVGHKSEIAVVQFMTASTSVPENAGKVTVMIERVGRLDNEFDCLIETIDLTAIKNLDYLPIQQRLRFRQNEKQKKLVIGIIDNYVKNEDKVFLVKLCIPEDMAERHDVAKGRICMMTVTIVDDDEPGIITFTDRLQTVSMFAAEAVIPVIRENGSDGGVRVFFKINEGTARNGKDFLLNPPEGEIFFPHSCTQQQIVVPLCLDFLDPFAHRDQDAHFEIELLKAENGARLGKHKKEIVFLTNESDVDVAHLMSRVIATQDQLQLHSSRGDWREQIRESFTPNGDGIANYILHLASFQWKVLFALIPPRTMYSGWLTFATSLILIGIITALVGDIATTFGCLVGLEQSLNAITFIAVGTSLPDLFASRTAVRIDHTADNAIGNVTGSNSVNVFLGLGLPWLMAAIHWKIQGQEFRVPSGDLGFAVVLYTAIAIIAILVLVIRRFCTGGEVGGSKRGALLTGLLLVSLWLLYVLLSALQVYGVIRL